jgi:hypothetical protein
VDAIINIRVGGNYLSKDSKNAGVRGEANATSLRITFDESWDKLAKTITFWDAQGKNPVKVTLGYEQIENIAKDTRTYIVRIPEEPLKIAGELTFVIDGTLNEVKKRSVADRFAVIDAPISIDASEPVEPIPSLLDQLQSEIDAIMGDLQAVANATEETKRNAEEAEKRANEANSAAQRAEKAVGKTSYIGKNGNWYAWDADKETFYDTGVKAQSGSTVYVGDNPADEADVWIDPDGDSIMCAPYIGENGNWYTFNPQTQTFSDSGVSAVGYTEQDKSEIKAYIDGLFNATVAEALEADY